MIIKFGQIVHTAEPMRLLMESESVAMTNSHTVGCGYWIMKEGKQTTAVFVYDPFQDFTYGHAVPCFQQTAEDQRYERYLGF